jgi:predicted RNA binding protein YcfA (HicA-like mRNA interferase family)
VTYKELSRRSAVIPNHPGDIPVGTLRAILKHLDITRDDLDSA